MKLQRIGKPSAQRIAAQKVIARAALVAAAMTVTVARADVIINNFDNASEVPQWRFDFGATASHTETFSTDDANGSATSGSLDINLNFDTVGGTQNQYADYTRDAFFPGLDGSPFKFLQMDVKVVPGAAVDQFNQSGYFELALRNTDNYNSVNQFADNLRVSDGWRHISVPLTAPFNAIRALTFQLYGGTALNGTVDLRIDNVALISSTPPGVLRAGHQFSFEGAGEVDSAHYAGNGSTPGNFTFGDSYDGNAVHVTTEHSRSTSYPTDGSRSLRISQPLNTYTVGTQVTYNSSDTAKFNTFTKGTKVLIDTTTPGHGPGYQTLEADVNEGGHYYSSNGANHYQIVFGNPGGAQTRTGPSTQTYTWDFGGQMQFADGEYFAGLTNYSILHIVTGNGGSATGDTAPDTSSQYFLDNVRIVNEDTLTRPTYQTVATADWTSASNWTNGVPNAVNAPAIFYGIGSGTGSATVNSTVNVNSAITVGSIIFDSQITSFAYAGTSNSVTSVNNLPQTVNYSLSGTGSLIIDSGTATSEIYAIAGSHTIGVPMLVKSNLEIDTSAGFGMDVNSGLPGGGRFSHVDMTSLTMTGPVTLASDVTLTTHGPGTVSFGSVTGSSGGVVINGGNGNFGANVNVGSFAVAVAGKATIAAGGSNVLRTGALSVLGTLDLTNNKAIVDYATDSPLTSIRDAVVAGYNNGSWNGVGIISSSAATIAGDVNNTQKTAIGYAEASALGIGTFAGQSVDGTAIVLRYTYQGDANLDGKVNALDFNAVAANYSGSAGKFWNQGDFNFDGNVNSQDFTALSGNFNLVLAGPALGTLVPEPASIASLLVAMSAPVLMRRRRV